MAVTTGELSIALRLTADGTGLSSAQTAILARLLGVGESHTALLIPTAPEAVQDECVIRLASYLYGQPIGRRDSYANSWVNSGAGSLASRWHQQAVSGGGTPGASPSTIADGIDEAAVLALFATWTQVGNTDQIPANKLQLAGGGLGTETDTVARASAQEAHDAADQAQVDATTAQGEIDTHEASTHNVDSTARSEAQAAQGLITGHEVATAPHNAAIAELIEEHRLVSDSHHTPGEGGVGGLTAAAAAQADLDAHEATQHNHDAGAVQRQRRRNRTLTPPKQPPVKHRLRQRRRKLTLIPTRLTILVVVAHPRPSYMTELRHWRQVPPNYPVRSFAHKPDSWKSI